MFSHRYFYLFFCRFLLQNFFMYSLRDLQTIIMGDVQTFQRFERFWPFLSLKKNVRVFNSFSTWLTAELAQNRYFPKFSKKKKKVTTLSRPAKTVIYSTISARYFLNFYYYFFPLIGLSVMFLNYLLQNNLYRSYLRCTDVVLRHEHVKNYSRGINTNGF